MALKVLPPASEQDAARRARLVEALHPLAERVASHELTMISIGDRCLTSGVLQTLGVRRKAFPFDWLFSSLAMVEHCLKDNFAEFLNPRQYETVPLAQRSKPSVHRTHHRLYRDRFGVEHVFNHHEMPDALPHFERSVARFRGAPNRQLVHIAGGHAPDVVAKVQAVAEAAEAKVLAVCLRPEPTRVAPEVRHFAGGEDYDVYEMATTAPVRGLGFGSSRDEQAFGRLLLSHFD